MAKKIQGSFTVVRILLAKGESALVEYVDMDGVLQRKFVPARKVLNGMVADEVLERAIPYGLPLDEMVLVFDARQFAVEMHNADLWTAEDILRNPKRVSAVLRKITEGSLKAILENALLEKKRS